MNLDYDYVIIGSGFGGSVSALRLSEKGYRVLVIEKGMWKKPEDFAKRNWQIRKWYWRPGLKLFGIFQMSFFKHVTVLSGAGVGGGSLVYANTLPVPKRPFFESTSWRHLADWHKELKPHYKTAQFMLGATANPNLYIGDEALKEVGKDLNLPAKSFEKTDVAIFFGKPDVSVADPYFKGEGPDRTGCNFCGACMIGCQHNAKNTLDKNYLYLAQKQGAKILAEHEVNDVIPLGDVSGNGNEGYQISFRCSTKYFSKQKSLTTKGVIFSAGVLGTVKLLLGLKEKSLPHLSDTLGDSVRTNNESIIAVTSADKDKVFSKGVAISSILNIDEHSHVEPVRNADGSGIWRLIVWPAAFGKTMVSRMGQVIGNFFKNPLQYLKIFLVKDWARQTQILLFMQTLDSTLRFKLGLFGLKSAVSTGEKPSSFIPEARDVANRFAKKLNARLFNLNLETLLGIPSTAHILGGSCMAENESTGVIDKDNHVFGYENMLVCDGSMISANIGVNPSLTITALTERAMSKIKPLAKGKKITTKPATKAVKKSAVKKSTKKKPKAKKVARKKTGRKVQKKNK